MIQLTILNNLIDIKNGKEVLVGKNIKTKMWVNREDISSISEVYNIKTKGHYKRRCSIRIKEIGEVIVLIKTEDAVKLITKPIIYGFNAKRTQ